MEEGLPLGLAHSIHGLSHTNSASFSLFLFFYILTHTLLNLASTIVSYEQAHIHTQMHSLFQPLRELFTVIGPQSYYGLLRPRPQLPSRVSFAHPHRVTPFDRMFPPFARAVIFSHTQMVSDFSHQWSLWKFLTHTPTPTPTITLSPTSSHSHPFCTPSHYAEFHTHTQSHRVSDTVLVA